MAIKRDDNGTLAIYNEWSSDLTYQDHRDRTISLLVLLGAAEDGKIDQTDIKNVCGVIMDMLPSEDDYKALDLMNGEGKQ